MVYQVIYYQLTLRSAIESIGEITGQITNDEMLGNIFSNFCIGK
jgi:tRNA modification GTPase